jgi:hypothetical protein
MPCQPAVGRFAGKLLKVKGIFLVQKLTFEQLWRRQADSTSKSRIFT